jgi:hypothetical protein
MADVKRRARSADMQRVGLVLRHRLATALVAVAVCATAGFFVVARPQYRPPHQGTSIRIPEKRPAADAAGRAGWVWPDGVPGWRPGETIKGFNISWIQPVEAQPAQLSAAHSGLDAEKLRVVDAEHLYPGWGPLAIFAAPTAYSTPPTTCLAVALPSSDRVDWRCDLAHTLFLAGAVRRHGAFALVGVARGDVRRIVLRAGGRSTAVYDRGTTWGQFEANIMLKPADVPELRIYGDRGLMRTLRLGLGPDEQRVVG